jgi:hypothetical protein
MAMQAFRLANESRIGSENESLVIRPGLDASAVQFEASVSAALDEGNNVGILPVISGPLPNEAENDRRMQWWKFSSNEHIGSFPGFNLRDFFKNLHKTVPFGKQAYKSWWEPANSTWEDFALTLVKDGLRIRTTSTEEWVEDIRAWLRHHRGTKADEWDWKKAMESQVYKDMRVRIPRSKILPMRECLQQGYVTRYFPIAHHIIPVITASGCVFESEGEWADSRMANIGPREGPCENPGLYMFESLNDCNKFGVATDILGDGLSYVTILEVQVLEGNKTAVQPPRRQCPGGVYYDDRCRISALRIRQCGLRAEQNDGCVWGNLGQTARRLPIIDDDLWARRAIRTPQQLSTREKKRPVEPHNRRVVISIIRGLIAKHFVEITSRPTPPPPLSDLVIPENEEGDTSMDEGDESDVEYGHPGGYNPWRAQLDHVVSAAPIAPSTLGSTPSKHYGGSGRSRCIRTRSLGIINLAHYSYSYNGRYGSLDGNDEGRELSQHLRISGAGGYANSPRPYERMRRRTIPQGCWRTALFDRVGGIPSCGIEGAARRNCATRRGVGCIPSYGAEGDIARCNVNIFSRNNCARRIWVYHRYLECGEPGYGEGRRGDASIST